MALLVGAATLISGAPRLALSTAGGILGALLVLLVAALGVRLLARRLARSSVTRGRPALRWALAALGGPSGETASVVLSLGLGLTVLAAIGQIDSNLRGLITGELPERAPAYFFVDIQNDQLAGFLETSRSEPGVSEVETAPMLRGIITRINDRPAGEVAPGHWVLEGDRGVTYAAAPPEGSVLTAGEWWPADYDGPPVMSFAAEEALEMGIGIGDRLTVNILGRDLTAEITSLREVSFESMGINFIMAVNPSALAGAPHTHIATVYAAPEAEAPLLRAVADQWPNITAVRVREAIDRVAEALDGLGCGDALGGLGDAADRARGADRRGGGGRAAAGLRGGGPQDARREPRPHPRELRAALGADRHGGGHRGDRRRRHRRLVGHHLRDGWQLPLRAGLGLRDRDRRRAGEPARRPRLRPAPARREAGPDPAGPGVAPRARRYAASPLHGRLIGHQHRFQGKTP